LARNRFSGSPEIIGFQGFKVLPPCGLIRFALGLFMLLQILAGVVLLAGIDDPCLP
jgi:hypothetical protein